MNERVWQLRFLRPVSSTKRELRIVVAEAMRQYALWIRSDFVTALVYGGNGIIGIRDTEFYKFVSSPRGLSELGIEASEPPKLLSAYIRSFQFMLSNNSVRILFGENQFLIDSTPHPASGTGKLTVGSWMNWVIGGQKVSDAGFVARKDVPPFLRGNIRLGSPLGGLMLPKEYKTSSGQWSFPEALKKYDKVWFEQNKKAIEAYALSGFITVLNKVTK